MRERVEGVGVEEFGLEGELGLEEECKSKRGTKTSYHPIHERRQTEEE